MDNRIKKIGYVCFCLTAFFSVLKLANVIIWPWIWILSPLWIPFAAVVAILLVFLLISGLCLLIKKTIRALD